MLRLMQDISSITKVWTGLCHTFSISVVCLYFVYDAYLSQTSLLHIINLSVKIGGKSEGTI